MALPGPQPKPAELARLDGYPGKGCRKSNADLGKQAAAADQLAPVGEPYPDMSDKAKAKWEELRRVWWILLKETDREPLRIYCETWCDLMEAQTMVLAFGAIMPTITGDSFRESPWSIKVHRYRQMLHKMLQDFGATPASRQRVELNNSGPVDPTSKFKGLVNTPVTGKAN